MAAETHLFHCLQRQFRRADPRPATGATAAIDAPEAAPVEAALKAKGWKLTDILVTHHHADHTAGIAELKKKYSAAWWRRTPRRPRFRWSTRPCAKATRSASASSAPRDRDAGPHLGPHLLLVPCRQARVRRRHAVLDRLRPRDRRHAWR